MTLPVGTVVDRYRVETLIGAGSMGDVVQGVDVDLHRQVAIKILSEKHRENDELRARFVREGRAVAAISHPNVVQVFTTGSHDDRPYIAMELLRGIDLGSVIKSSGKMSSLTAARAILDAARGLDAAAKAGLIHRDVKPSNLVLLESGTVKVTDFGLAKPLNPSSEPSLTALGVVVGTPDYIAPEQARGDPIDERVDIYALGGTLYFLLTASPPYRKGNAAADKYLKVVARHLKDPVPDALAQNRLVDPELNQLMRRMMAKSASERPHYAELEAELAAIIERLEAAGAHQSHGGMKPVRQPTEPTPYLGGSEQLSLDDDSDAAATLIRAKEPSASLSAAEAPRKPKPNKSLILLTIACALLFLVGLGLRFFGPIPDSGEAVARSSYDAGAATLESDAAPPPRRLEQSIPDGMMLVKRADGTPWFFVDVKPVDHDTFARLFPQQKKPSKKGGADPVVRVAYEAAEACAKALGRRLLTAEEWRAAAATDGFVSAGRKRWEWVRGGDEGGKRAVLRDPDKSALRSAKAHKDVTFRLARDL